MSQLTGTGILWRCLRRQWRRALLGSIFLGSWQLCEAMVPVAIGLVVDHAVLPLDRTLLLVGLASVLVLFVVLSFSYRIGSRALHRATNHEGHALRVEVASHALMRSSDAHLVPGEVMSRSTADATATTRIFSQLGMSVSAAAGFLGAAGYLLYTSPLVGALVLVIAPVISLIVTSAGRGISARSRAQQEATAEAGARAGDIMAGVRVLKAIGGERWAGQTYVSASRLSAEAAVKTASATGKVAGVGEFAVAVNLAAVLLLAGWQVVEGALGAGQLVAIVGVAIYLSEPIRLLGNATAAAAVAHGAAGRIAEFLNSEPSETLIDARVEDQAGDLPDGGAPGTLYVLPFDHDNLEVSTPERLVVPHSADIFEGTLRSNITMSHDPNEDVSTEVLAAAGVLEIIDNLPDGLDAPIRDAGSNLSGGQRQRLALARALHADPPILVLNDPTSAVDSVTEAAIAAGIRRVRQGRITIVRTNSRVFHSVANEVTQ